MYKIKFPSGEVATIESPEALTEAVHSGSVTSYCFILHERSGQWLPIVRHPHYHQALTARTASSPSAPVADAPPILPEPLAAPVAPPPPGRSTQAALDVPDLDELLEMTEAPAKPAPSQPAAARTRSRDLEFLYVPEAKAAGQPRATPRTAGPPPRPAAVKPPAPKAEAASAPTAPRPEPAAVVEQPVIVAAAEAPAVVEAPSAPAVLEPAMVEEPVAAPVATLAPPMRRSAERYDHDLVDPVEAALNFDPPAPIELTETPREWAPSGARRLLIAAGLVVALGGGVLAWSPWSGGATEVAAAAAPAADQNARGVETPAAPGFDMDTPAEETPALEPYSLSVNDPAAARTSFGGTAAQSGAAVSELPQPAPAVLPGAPRDLRVAVPVVGSTENLDSLRLAKVKAAISQ
jgi:hypothetical protein